MCLFVEITSSPPVDPSLIIFFTCLHSPPAKQSAISQVYSLNTHIHREYFSHTNHRRLLLHVDELVALELSTLWANPVRQFLTVKANEYGCVQARGAHRDTDCNGSFCSETGFSWLLQMRWFLDTHYFDRWCNAASARPMSHAEASGVLKLWCHGMS